jgi:hypothetical protein
MPEAARRVDARDSGAPLSSTEFSLIASFTLGVGGPIGGYGKPPEGDHGCHGHHGELL